MTIFLLIMIPAVLLGVVWFITAIGAWALDNDDLWESMDNSLEPPPDEYYNANIPDKKE